MVASLARRAPPVARLLLGAALFFAGTSPIAFQDLGALLVNQPGVAERARTFLLSNPFSALRTATFALPNLASFAIPRLPVRDHFAVIHASLPGASGDEPLDLEPAPRAATVNRESKRSRLVPAPKESVRTIPSSRTQPDRHSAAGSEISAEAWLDVEDVEPFGFEAEFAGVIARDLAPIPSSGSILGLTHVIFGSDEHELPRVAFEHVTPSPVVRLRYAALPESTPDEATSVASKGQVTGDDATPRSPAERLGLYGSARAKAEKCLADAIYFESRGESERGQIAVAQVVMNRVFSGYYPEDVCETVYQNAHRHLACQFTFACEGKQLIVNDQTSWRRATRIARNMLDGKLWLDEVGKATHYHAYWVKPRWIREMRTIEKIGVHTFYRPRRWEEKEVVAAGS